MASRMCSCFLGGKKLEVYRRVVVDTLYGISKTVLKLLQACVEENTPTIGYLPSQLHHNKK